MIWVDDLFIFGKDLRKIEEFKVEIGKELAKDLGEVEYFRNQGYPDKAPSNSHLTSQLSRYS